MELRSPPSTTNSHYGRSDGEPCGPRSRQVRASVSTGLRPSRLVFTFGSLIPTESVSPSPNKASRPARFFQRIRGGHFEQRKKKNADWLTVMATSLHAFLRRKLWTNRSAPRYVSAPSKAQLGFAARRYRSFKRLRHHDLRPGLDSTGSGFFLCMGTPTTREFRPCHSGARLDARFSSFQTHALKLRRS